MKRLEFLASWLASTSIHTKLSFFAQPICLTLMSRGVPYLHLRHCCIVSSHPRTNLQLRRSGKGPLDYTCLTWDCRTQIRFLTRNKDIAELNNVRI